MYFDGKEKTYQKIFRVQAVDTTAARDTFTGFFMASLIEGKSIAEALKAASKASSIAVSRPGAAGSITSASEVMESLM